MYACESGLLSVRLKLQSFLLKHIFTVKILPHKSPNTLISETSAGILYTLKVNQNLLFLRNHMKIDLNPFQIQINFKHERIHNQ